MNAENFSDSFDVAVEITVVNFDLGFVKHENFLVDKLRGLLVF